MNQGRLLNRVNLPRHLFSGPATSASTGDAAWKLAAALAFVVSVVLLPRDAWGWHGGAALLLFAVAVWSGVSLGSWGGRLLWLEPFALSVAALALFQPGGVWVFFAMLTKSSLCIASMLLLSLVTPFHESLQVLRRWHVPGLLVTTLALAHRYLFVLGDEAQRMHRARQSRTLVRRRTQWWRLLSGIIAQLFVRATTRAERIHAAMCARGWKP